MSIIDTHLIQRVLGKPRTSTQPSRSSIPTPKKYDIDRHRISVGGRSTGCTLALGAALKLQEKNEEHMLKNLYLFLPSINNLMWTEPNIFDESVWTDSVKFMYTKMQNFMKAAWTHSTNDYEKETRDNIYMFPGKASLA